MLAIVIIISLVGFVYIYFIRKHDRYEPESVFKMLLATLIGGIISIFVSLALYAVVYKETFFLEHYFVVGPVEEFSKLLALAIVYAILKKDFNESVDGLVYISCVALGFASIENYFYAVSSEDTYYTLAIRSVICVIAHMAFSSFMGFAFYVHKKVKKNYMGLLFAILFAAFTHGSYNTILTIFGLNFYAVFFTFMAVSLQLFLVRYTLSISEFKPQFELDDYNKSDNAVHAHCVNCETNNHNHEYHLNKVKLTICVECDNVVIDDDNLELLFKFHRPLLKWKKFVNKEISDETTIHYFDDQQDLKFNVERGWASFKQDKITAWLSEANQSDISDMYENNWRAMVLNLIGYDLQDHREHLENKKQQEQQDL